MKRLTVSPSAVNAWLECPRKLAWKDSGVVTPSKPAAELGTKVHSVAEAYLKEGTMPNMLTREGEIFAAGMHHLPKVDFPGLTVEYEFTREFEGVPFNGRIDFGIPELPLVGDHKTTSDFKYIRNLQVDTQANIYAWNAMEDANKDECHLLWVYYLTKAKPKSRPVMATLTKVDNLLRMRRLAAVGRDILTAINTVDDPLSYPKNLDACEMYGGCPYQHLCQITPAEKLKALMSAKTMSTADFLASINAGKGVNPPKTEEPKPVVEPSEANAFLASLGKVAPGPTATEPTTPVWAKPDLSKLTVPAPAEVKRGPGRPPKTPPTMAASAAAPFSGATVKLASPEGRALLNGVMDLDEAAQAALKQGLSEIKEAHEAGTEVKLNLSRAALNLSEALKAIAELP